MDRSLRKWRSGTGLAGLVFAIWFGLPITNAAAAERALCLKHPRNGVLRAWPNIREGCYGRVLHGRLAYRRNFFDKLACNDSKARRSARWSEFKSKYSNRCSCKNALRLVEAGVKTKKSKGISGFIKDWARETEFLNVEIRSMSNRNRVYQLGSGLQADGFVPTARADQSLTRFRVRRPDGDSPSRLNELRNGDRIKLEMIGKGSSYVNFAGDTLSVSRPAGGCR